jgi:hypothetical protein
MSTALTTSATTSVGASSVFQQRANLAVASHRCLGTSKPCRYASHTRVVSRRGGAFTDQADMAVLFARTARYLKPAPTKEDATASSEGVCRSQGGAKVPTFMT